MDRRGEGGRSGNLWPPLRRGDSGAGDLENGGIGERPSLVLALSRLGSQAFKGVPRRDSGYLRVNDPEAISLIPLDRGDGTPRLERRSDTTRSGSLARPPSRGDRPRDDDRRLLGSPSVRGPGGLPVPERGVSRRGAHNAKAIPKFRNGYLRMADLEAISKEQMANQGRGPAPTSTLEYILAASGSASSSSTSIRRDGGKGSRPAPPGSYFCRVLEQELTRVRRFAENFAEELWVRLGSLFESLDLLTTEGKRTQTAIAVERIDATSVACDLIADDVILLDEFFRQNVVASAFVAQKHDSKMVRTDLRDPKIPAHVSPAYLQAMEKFLRGAIAYDPILINLSDAYCQVKGLRMMAYADGTMWNAPEVFERKTIKYWVHPANVLRVKCMLIKHLPILIYGAGKGQADAKSRLSSLKEQTQRDGTLISSVYFDNDELQTYHDRLRREHGSSLTRIRWYKKRVLTDDMETFIERKIHGDSWTGIKSVKERSPMPAKEVARFIKGEHVSAMDAEGSKGERLLDIQTKVFGQRREEPSMRSEYVRVAFQESTSNEVRISLDSHVRMIREKGAPRGPTGWHRDVVMNEPDPRDVVNFPYAILETKVAGEDTPEWVQEILNTGMLVPVPKFSKFLHGSALLFGDAVCHSPFWFVPDDHNRYTPATIEEMADPHDEFDKNAGRLLQQTTTRTHENAGRPPQQTTTRTREVSNRLPLTEVLVVPSQEAEGASRLAEAANAKKDEKKSARTAALVRTRIEPKTFFANERTFLSWLTVAVLVMFMGLTLLEGSSPGGGPVGVGATTGRACELDGSCRVREISGALISGVALMLLAYALYQYRKRSIQILQRTTIRFDDQRGPALITILLLAVLITAFVLSLKSNL